ncbi:uncharacterized protein LOC111349960 isoform X1 [Spodoptera litura]|uniref:Uncharacterized protein LOC111349960 isoform X1 n=1 Tax=Spodoptera litura TaxID=69820 RepID=A0A9J7ILB3_SPOLT|nr:uncharacterized protein LOC111349960 isoform X1 [Spodoptera litura]
MHRQLHHGTKDTCADILKSTTKALPEKPLPVPRSTALSPTYSHKSKGSKLLGRTSSATRLFDKLRARICRSRTLFSHPEENLDATIADNNGDVNETVIGSDCTSKGLKALTSSPDSRTSEITVRETKETFACHLCSFDADRITVLDRHLLNDHKIGLENLLKLVMAKTKDGLSEEIVNTAIYGIRQPYYKPPDEIIEDGEFVIETVTPKIKILKHASTNTDIQWSDIPDLKDNCRMISKELEKLINYPIENYDKDDFMTKMQTLNDCMCKFVDSSNTLKKILTKEFDTKHSIRDHLNLDQPFYDLCLGDSRNTSRVWERAHSEQMDRNRNKYGENRRHRDSYVSFSCAHAAHEYESRCDLRLIRAFLE